MSKSTVALQENDLLCLAVAQAWASGGGCTPVEATAWLHETAKDLITLAETLLVLATINRGPAYVPPKGES